MIHRSIKTDTETLNRPSWRDYQSGLKCSAAKKKLVTGIFKVSALFFVILGVGSGMISGLEGTSFSHLMTDYFSSSNGEKRGADSDRVLLSDKKHVQNLIDNISLVNLENNRIDVFNNGDRYSVDTTLDIPLQNFILKKLDTSTARYIGIVGIDPVTGKVLSMVSFDKTDPSSNLCVESKFPAASIFKIVTASAAIEKNGFRPNRELKYNGMKHTLYKSQLKKKTNKYTNRVSFQDSFAQSINPVFGKIGVYYLGKTALEKYAEAFGFNQNINFEIQVDPSGVHLSDTPYQWAEIACGFNQDTTLSPLHGAMMASAIVNQGRLMEPAIVVRIVDESGNVIYRNTSVSMSQAITPEASKTLNALMAETIRSGTAKKAFRGYRKDKILSRLNIGGKTGSMDNDTHDARYDWFVGFAEEKGGPAKFAVAVIVAHEKYIGLRASYYARSAMKSYFSNYFAKKQILTSEAKKK
ncbi:MAG: penicillin-binding transpeptidase domain-containing protein [Desulfobacterales bacterium]